MEGFVSGSIARVRGGLPSWRKVVLRYGIVVVLVVMVVVAALLYPGFLSFRNVTNILSQNAPIGIVAVGMTFVIIAGGSILSVGAVVGLGATLFASLTLQHSLLAGAAAAIVVGIVVGTATGIVVNRLHVNPFVATLGAASVISGFMLIYSGTQPYVVSDTTFQQLGAGRIGDIPISIFVLAAVLVAGRWSLGGQSTAAGSTPSAETPRQATCQGYESS